MPVVPFCTDVVVILNVDAELIVMLRGSAAVRAVGVVESVTVAVKWKVPVQEPVGVPVIAPVTELRLKQEGNDPVVPQVYGEMPPLAVKVAL